MNIKFRCAYQMKPFSLIGKMENDLVSTEKRKRKPSFKPMIELTHSNTGLNCVGPFTRLFFFFKYYCKCVFSSLYFFFFF